MRARESNRRGSRKVINFTLKGPKCQVHYQLTARGNWSLVSTVRLSPAPKSWCSRRPEIKSEFDGVGVCGIACTSAIPNGQTNSGTEATSSLNSTYELELLEYDRYTSKARDSGSFQNPSTLLFVVSTTLLRNLNLNLNLSAFNVGISQSASTAPAPAEAEAEAEAEEATQRPRTELTSPTLLRFQALGTSNPFEFAITSH
jgi:hypothetical protein